MIVNNECNIPHIIPPNQSVLGGCSSFNIWVFNDNTE